MAKAFLGVRATANIPSSPSDDGRTPSTTEDPAVIDSRTAQMQAILNAGSVLHLKDGVYVVNQLVITSRTGIEGESQQGTILFANEGLNSDFIISENYDSLTGTPAKYKEDGVPEHCSLKNLTVDGNCRYSYTGDELNANGNESGDAVNFFVYHPLISNVYITRSPGAAYRQELGDGDQQAPADGWFVRDQSMGGGIINSAIFNCNEGIVHEAGSDLRMEGLNISSIVKSGIWIKAGSGSDWITAHVWNCGHNGGALDVVAVRLEGNSYLRYLQLDANFFTGLEVKTAYVAIDELYLVGPRAVAANVPAVRIAGHTCRIGLLKGPVYNGARGLEFTNSGNRSQVDNLCLWGTDESVDSANLVYCQAGRVRIKGMLFYANVAFQLGSGSNDVDACDIDLTVDRAQVALDANINRANDIKLKYDTYTVVAPGTITEAPGGAENDTVVKTFATGP